jgi:hypothetical protein
VARILGIIVLSCSLLIMLGAGICSGLFDRIGGYAPLFALVFALVCGAAAASGLVHLLNAKETRPRVDAPPRNERDSAHPEKPT